MRSLLLAAVLVVAGALPASAQAYHPDSFWEMAANVAQWTLTGQDTARPANGVNRPCKPSAAHPEPVVLVHGLQGNQYNGWAFIGPSLVNAGYCVFSLNFGDGGTKPIASSATEISRFVDQVLTGTGAAKVHLVGHSEGGFLVEYLPKMIPGQAARTRSVVAIAPPMHGTDLWGVATIVTILGLGPAVGAFCPACADLLPGSAAVTALTNGPVAQQGISYTTIISRYDPAITPYTSAAINEPGVKNIVVQDVCPGEPLGHTGPAYDKGVLTMITNALDPAHPAPVHCDSGFPF
jgi:triacylglycerol esterase/lipase EstA (alpha/beta hydrolase family)